MVGGEGVPDKVVVCNGKVSGRKESERGRGKVGRMGGRMGGRERWNGMIPSGLKKECLALFHSLSL